MKTTTTDDQTDVETEGEVGSRRKRKEADRGGRKQAEE